MRANAAALTKVILGTMSRVRVRGLDEHGTNVAGSGDTIDSAGVREPNVILLKAQSINGLGRVSQLCPRTAKQLESSRVTQNVMECFSPLGKETRRSIAFRITELVNPSNKQSGIRVMS